MKLENQPNNTTSIILNPKTNKVLCVTRNGKQFLAVWTDTSAALVALSRRKEDEWTLVSYKDADHTLLFQIVSGSVPGQLDGYVVDPGTYGEQKRLVDTITLAA